MKRNYAVYLKKAQINSGKQFMDVVYAEDETEAIAVVSSKRGIQVSDLGTDEIELRVGGTALFDEGTHSFSFYASSYEKDQLTGIKVILPDGRSALVVFNHDNLGLQIIIKDENEEELPRVIDL